MNIYFSGIGGVGIGPLAEIAHDAGYYAVGSDTSDSLMTTRLRKKGVAIATQQDGSFLREQHEKTPFDWFIYTSALSDTHPELVLARQLGIRTAKRDELLAHIIAEKDLKLIAVAGTHGKTTTTGMLVWLANYFNIPVSYSIGTTLSWGPSGQYTPGSSYFIYECDEFDRNFLHFHPFVSLVTSIEHDHHDTYPTKDEYFAAFRQFAGQSESLYTWDDYRSVFGTTDTVTYLKATNPLLSIRGEHNRRNASLILAALEHFNISSRDAAEGLCAFPGTQRRFERLSENLYTDYGHTPSEIAATLQMANEISDHVVLVYQPHQNVRQHEIIDQYTNKIFDGAEVTYWLPTYLSREVTDQPILSPQDLSKGIKNSVIADLDDELWQRIQADRDSGKLVLCMGAGSIDNWVRQRLAADTRSHSS